MEPIDAQGQEEEALACEDNSGEDRNVAEQPPLQKDGESSDDYISRLDGWKTHQWDVLKAAYHGRDSNLLMGAFFAMTTAVENAKLGALKENNKVLTEENKVLTEASKARDKALKNFPTLCEVAKRNINFPNETDSSSHTETGHLPASHTHMEIPPVRLPDSFWQRRTHVNFKARINSEADVNAELRYLLRDIARALGLNSYLYATLGLPIMDITQDVAIISQQTEHIAGVVEGKKHPRSLTEEGKIFGSDTQVAGEVFEQLVLVSLQNETFAVGLVATLQSFQLVCTKNIGNEVLTANDAIEYFESKSSSANLEKTLDKQQVLPHCTEPSIDRCSKRSKIELNNTQAKEGERRTKSGQGAIEIEDEQIKRRYFATTPVSFGNEEASNRKVFELLAAYLLLCVKSLKEAPNPPIHLPEKGDCCLARKLSLGNSSFPFKQIRLNRDIAFDARLTVSDKDLFVIRQLGYGLSGAACFGCVEATAAPCVIKFFRKKYTIDTAKTEESHWRSLYSGLGFDFVQATATPRVLLLMPFLRVPRDLSARKHFLDGGKDSLLYKALQHVAKKGYVHREVFWHHIGLINVSNNQESTEIAVFCDLSHIERRENDAERQDWVERSFESMMRRVGDGINAF